MNVAVVAEQVRRSVPGGIGRYATGLLGGLAELDASDRQEIQVWASRANGTDPLAEYGFPVGGSVWPGPVMTRLWDRNALRVPRSIDVVHATSMAVPPVRRGTHLTVTVHDLAWRHRPEATTDRGRKWHEHALARIRERADRIIVPSAATGEACKDAGIDAARIRTVTWGTDHLPAPDRERARALVRRLGVDGPFILSVGTREPRKNLEGLVRAIVEGKIATPLVIVGPHGWGEDLVETPGVHLAGAVDDGVLAGLYAEADCFVYVPFEEGFGLPPLEAMTVGTPVVVSDTVPSVAEFATPPAIVVPAGDPMAIASACAGVLGDARLAEELVRLGHEAIEGRRWRDVAARHVEIWGELG